jgi:hypothetical protein
MRKPLCRVAWRSLQEGKDTYSVDYGSPS